MNKKISIVITVLIVLIISLFFIDYFTAKKSEGIIDVSKLPVTPKKYEANEYYSFNISKQELCTIYLNDYISILSTDTLKAYNMLDENYRNIKFPSYDSFVNYVNTIYPTISSISTYKISGQKYYITDKNNNLFIIVTNGVMNYKVYLDDYTVDITNYDK